MSYSSGFLVSKYASEEVGISVVAISGVVISVAVISVSNVVILLAMN